MVIKKFTAIIAMTKRVFDLLFSRVGNLLKKKVNELMTP